MDFKRCCRCKVDLPVSEFKGNSRKSDGLQSQCINCQKQYRREHYEKNRQKYIDKARVWNQEFLEWWNEYKSQLSCETCGESHIATLDFHHKDPSQKEREVSVLVSNGNRKKILDEIAKCAVLCANCHRIHHYTERQMRV